MVKRPDFEEFKRIAMKDKEFRKEYELLRPEFEILHKFINARKKAKVSQAELAKTLNLKQPAVARLEKGGYTTTSVENLSRIADAMGYSFNVSLKPKSKIAKTSKKRVKKAL